MKLKTYVLKVGDTTVYIRTRYPLPERVMVTATPSHLKILDLDREGLKLVATELKD
jgi:hypothetical protein